MSGQRKPARPERQPPSPRRVLLLINNAKLADAREFLPEAAPDRHCIPGLPAESGFIGEVMTIQRRPWNPLAGWHEAFAALDPLRALRVLLRRRHVAVVCAHLESAFVLLWLRRWFRFKPKIVVWEVPWSPGWRYREWLNRQVISRADCSVVYSRNQLALVKATFGEATPVAFVPFCVDLDFYRPQEQPPSAMPLILSMGLDRGRDFKLLLVATVGLATPVLIKTAALDFDPAEHSNVTLITERLSYQRYRDLYVQASVVVVATEDTPNACGVTSLMEALAMGKPTIVTDNPALRDYLPPAHAGVVVAVGDGAALRAAIVDLLGNPAKAEAMGRRAREFAEQRFHPRLHAQAAAELFGQIIDRNALAQA